MTKSIEGGCFCGHLRYRFPEQPYPAGNCHCRMCQRLSGSAYVSWVVIPITKFEYLGAEPKILKSSLKATRHFCQECGTPLAYIQEKRPDEIAVTVCSLDDPEKYVPTVDLFTDTKLAWLT